MRTDEDSVPALQVLWLPLPWPQHTGTRPGLQGTRSTASHSDVQVAPGQGAAAAQQNLTRPTWSAAGFPTRAA